MTSLHTWTAGDQLNASDINANFLAVAETNLITTLIAGENLSDKDAVSIGDGSQASVGAEASASSHGPLLTSTNWSAMSFTTPSQDIDSMVAIGVLINNLYAGPQNGTFTFELHTDASGVPSGTVLGSVSTGSLGFINGEIKYTSVTFPTAVLVSVSTKYWIVVKCTAYDQTGFAIENATPTTNVGQNTGNSGSTWTANANDYMAYYTYNICVLGRLYRASSVANDFRFKNWIGFNKGACTAGGTAVVAIGGLVDFLTGLTQGTYYLNDTNGSVGTAAGTNSKKIGLAISGTQLLIKHDNA